VAYFAGNGGTVRIVNPGSPVTINVTSSGGAATAYSDAARSSAVTLPLTTTIDQQLYFARSGEYTVSVTQGGVEIATAEGNPATFRLANGASVTVAPSVDDTPNFEGVAHFDVTAYGAAGDNVTDDSDAIEAAQDACPEGGVIYFPPGIYRVSRPVAPRRNQTIRGSHRPRWYYRAGADCQIRPLSSFTGEAVVHIQDKSLTSEALDNDGGRIENICIDGNSVRPGGSDYLKGIFFEGLVRDWHVSHVDISQVSGNGVETDNGASAVGWPRGIYFDMVSVYSAGNLSTGVGQGFVFVNLTDGDAANLLAVDCQEHGFHISNPGEYHFIGCRAVFNDGNGFLIDGSATVGGATFTACSTDYNTLSGIYVTANGTQPLAFSNILTRRDGANGGAGGGSYAGFHVAGSSSGSGCPVFVSGLVQTVGQSDEDTGAWVPQYGVSVTNSSSTSISGELWGVTSALVDGGGNTRLDVAHVRRRRNDPSTVTIDTAVFGTQPAVAAGGGAGSTPPAPVLNAISTDSRGQLTWGTGTTPGTGAQVTVTFARPLERTPTVVINPTNVATANLNPYGASASTTGFTISAGVAPAGSQANSTYAIQYAVIPQS